MLDILSVLLFCTLVLYKYFKYGYGIIVGNLEVPDSSFRQIDMTFLWAASCRIQYSSVNK